MAEFPSPPEHGDDAGPTHFRTVEVRVDGRDLRLRRLGAQAAVDTARRENVAAHRALETATAAQHPSTEAARATAHETTETLHTAVAFLTVFDEEHPIHGSALRVDVEHELDPAVTVVRPHGELDLLTAPHFDAVCAGEIDASHPSAFVVDLSAVTFLDSSGLAVLVEVHHLCQENGGRLTVVGAGTRARRLLAITRLDTVFDIR